MRNSSFSVCILAAAIVCVSGCQKSNPDPDGDQTTCPFCNQDFNTEEECLNHQITCDFYESDSCFDEPVYVTVPEGEGHTGSYLVPLEKWMSEISSDTRIADLTIPGLHDAATYCYDGITTPTYVKDQNLDYKDAWKLGARAFDLRLGYDGRSFQGEFKDRCKFFHGDAIPGIVLGICMMRNFHIDITGHFPTKEQLKDECMILITKDEFHPSSNPCKKIDVFEYFMHLLIERYGKESFIAYSPDLTMGDCRGKIILFTREKAFTADYSTVGEKTPSVPVTYISGFPDDGDTNLTVYQSGNKQGEYKAYVQDKYNIGEKGQPKVKYNAFRTALENRKAKAPNLLFFNGMNGVQDKPSWDVCEYMNYFVAYDLRYLRHDRVDPPYEQPLGIVLSDFFGVVKYKHGKAWDERDFGGQALAEELVLHNFEKTYQTEE